MSSIDTESPPPLELEDEENLTLLEDLRLLASETRSMARTEIAFQKSRAAYATSEVRNVAVLTGIAAVFIFFAIMASVVGLVIALVPLIGAWGATALVTFALLLVAGLCAIAAKRRISRLMGAIGSGKAD